MATTRVAFVRQPVTIVALHSAQMREREGAALVSVLTPVYNGEKFLEECIESVLSQDYQNWEYQILNNCSTDRTLEIAESYARKDPRIRVTSNTDFVNVATNHNNVFRLISPQSRYTKVVSADDAIMPSCLSKMVAFAESHPAVGIIGAYQRSGDTFRWQDIPTAITVLSGRDACRLALLTGARIFGAPTAFLYRSDLLRGDRPFFPNSRPHADTSACYESLRHCDFGILHEVLSVERVHAGQVSSKIDTLGGSTVAYLEVFLEYGPSYLNETEFKARKKQIFDEYYRYLGGCVLKLREPEFWRFQSTRLRELGCRLEGHRVAQGAVKEALAEIRNPAVVARKIVSAVTGRVRKR